MPSVPVHGQILGGVVTTPDLEPALEDYCGLLGLRHVARGTVDEDLAASWGTPASAGAKMATLQPMSGASCFVRLVEAPLPADFEPVRTFGWAAFELSVQDVFSLDRKIRGGGFGVLGPPMELPELPFFVPMQVKGRGGEVLYLNEVRMDTPDSDLPKARSPTDMIFVVVLATPDRAESVAWYERELKLVEGGRYTLVYKLINDAFDLLSDAQCTISMVQNGRLPIVEIDPYPADATPRRIPGERLPPGNALATLAVTNFDALDLRFITPPRHRDGLIYEGRRHGTVRGYAGELIELVEVGNS